MEPGVPLGLWALNDSLALTGACWDRLLGSRVVFSCCSVLDDVGLPATSSGGVEARGEKDRRGPALLASQISGGSSEILLLLTNRETGGPFGFLCVTCEAGERGT